MEEKEKNNSKSKSDIQQVIKTFKQLSSTKRGRAILFFGMYIIFFLVLAVVARIGGVKDMIGTGYEKGNYNTFSIDNITSNNYHFRYTVVIDDKNYVYEGDRYQDSEVFTFRDHFSDKQFYKNKSDFYLKVNDLYIKNENPYVYYDFMDITTISKIMENSYFVSKTDYESGKHIYNFQLLTSAIVSYLENSSIDIEEIPNDVIFSTDSNGSINKIEFNLASYGKYKGISSDIFTIVLEYDHCGEIDEIISPLS